MTAGEFRANFEKARFRVRHKSSPLLQKSHGEFRTEEATLIAVFEFVTSFRDRWARRNKGKAKQKERAGSNGDCPQCPARFLVGSTSSAQTRGTREFARSWFFRRRRHKIAELAQSAKMICPHHPTHPDN